MGTRVQIGLLAVGLEMVGRRSPARALRAAVALQRGGHPRLDLWRRELEQVASALGIYSRPTRFFFIALGFVLVLLQHFSAALSLLSNRSKVSAQSRALLEQQLRQLARDQSTAEAVEQPFEKHEATEAGWPC
jgi:hypothetical protein